MKIKQKGFKVKGVNKKQGKTIPKEQTEKLPQKSVYQRTKDEVNPMPKFYPPEKKEQQPKTIEDFIDTVRSKHDEDKGLY